MLPPLAQFHMKKKRIIFDDEDESILLFVTSWPIGVFLFTTHQLNLTDPPAHNYVFFLLPTYLFSISKIILQHYRSVLFYDKQV